MASDTPVNSQITDAVTQSNLTVLGNAPAQSMATAYQVLAQSVGVSMQNMVANQQHKNSIDSAVVTGAVTVLYTLDTATTGKATQEILSGNPVAESMASLKGVMAAFNKDDPNTPAFSR